MATKMTFTANSCSDNSQYTCAVRGRNADSLKRRGVVGAPKKPASQDLPRNYNTSDELNTAIAMAGVKKSVNHFSKTLFLGMVAGVFVVWSGLFSCVAAGGIPEDVRKMWPMLPKMMVGLTFPVGIFFILLFGGELFTGNTMIMTVAYLNRKIGIKELSINWALAFIGNFIGCLISTYLFGYFSNFFVEDPFLSFVKGIAYKKVSHGFIRALVLAIPANALVCLCIFLGLASRDLGGKLAGMWIPIVVFAATGYEHCVANMFFIPLGMMYGADISVSQMIFNNIIPVGLGNIIGGGFFVGGCTYFIHHWQIGAKNAQCDNGLNEVHEFVIEDRYNEKPNNFKSNEMAVSIDHYVVDEDIAKH